MYCSTCGTKLPDGAQFCSNCGTKVVAEAAEEVKAEVVETDAEVKEAVVETVEEKKEEAVEAVAEVRKGKNGVFAGDFYRKAEDIAEDGLGVVGYSPVGVGRDLSHPLRF